MNVCYQLSSRDVVKRALMIKHAEKFLFFKQYVSNHSPKLEEQTTVPHR